MVFGLEGVSSELKHGYKIVKFHDRGLGIENPNGSTKCIYMSNL